MSADVDIEALNALARSSPPSLRRDDLPPPSHFAGTAANEDYAPRSLDSSGDFSPSIAAPDFLGKEEFVGLWLTLHMGLQGLISTKTGVSVPLADHAMTEQGLDASNATYDLICKHDGARRFLLSKNLGVMGSALPIVLYLGTLMNVTKQSIADHKASLPDAANDNKAPIFQSVRGGKS